MIGGAFFTSGLAEKLGNLLFKFVNVSERLFVTGVLTVGCLLCFFLNGALVFALLAPIVDSITSQSGGKLTRKQSYLPLGFSCAIGNNLTAISATSMIAASGLLYASGYGRQIKIFEPTVLTAPAVLAVIIFTFFSDINCRKDGLILKKYPLPKSIPARKAGSRQMENVVYSGTRRRSGSCPC